MPIHESKVCRRCGETKPLSAYTRDKNTRDGHHSRCRVCHAAGKRETRARHPETYREISRRQYANGHRSKGSAPIQHRAHVAVWRALKAGKLTRPPACTRCEAIGSVQAHHEDYTKPFDVQWVCSRCHGAIHAAEQRARWAARHRSAEEMA